jgi:hypothetical protein
MKASLVLLTALFITSAHQTLSGESSGDWTYSVSDSQATITGYSGVGGAVEIPAVVNEISVVKVGSGDLINNIFGNGNTTVTSVTIPDSVTSIGDFAFGYCTNLTSITIPESVTSIGDIALYSCTNLTSVNIPDSVTSIGVSAFSFCTNLNSVNIGNSVTSIGEDTFYHCTSLTSITVDTGNLNYSSVDGLLFNKLQTLLIQYPVGILDDSYTIPDSVTSIGYSAFAHCTSLTSVTIPDSVTSIGDIAFAHCTNLTSVTIPDSVTSIGEDAFSFCTNLNSVTIGNSVTSIGVSAFRSCTSLTSVTIPESVTSIGEDAFYACTNLTSVTLPILFINSYQDFALSNDQVLLYGSSAARDVPLSNNFKAGRTLGQQDVTASPSVYDLHTSTELAEATAAARTIVNVSARVNLGAEEAVIPGFVILGESKELLIRAIGPKLADLGVPSPLPDPTMTIYRTRYDGQPNDVVAIIDDWKADGADVDAINAAMISAGAFPLEPVADFQGNPLPTDDTKSAATLITLSVGVYTVVVTSADGGEGDVLVEAYEIY